jgi:hypothetical protein
MHTVRRHVQRGDDSAATLSASAALVVLGAMSCAAHADWTLGAEAGVRHDDNVGNSQAASDIVGDSSIDARLSLARLFPLAEGVSVTVGGDVGGEVFRKLTGLNDGYVDGMLAIRKKWGLGAFAPWARVQISAARSSYDLSYRNAWDYRATLAAGRRIDQRWNLWGEYAYERRAATPQTEEVPGLSGDAYSQDSHNVAANVEYSLSESAFISLGLSARHGDVVSTAEPTARIFTAARALADDPAFGPEAYAYKLTGTTYGFRVGLDYALTVHSLLGCGFERFDTRADGGNDYTKSIVTITWDYRF